MLASSDTISEPSEESLAFDCLISAWWRRAAGLLEFGDFIPRPRVYSAAQRVPSTSSFKKVLSSNVLLLWP